MADRGSIDELISKEIDQTQVSALVGSLESQLASAVNKEYHRTVSVSSVNNNHVGVNVVNAANNIMTRPQQGQQQQQQTLFSRQATQPHVITVNKTLPNNPAPINSSMKNSISNSQIIGISSILNTNSTQNRTNNNSSVNCSNNIITSSHPNHLNSVTTTQPFDFLSKQQQINNSMSPTIRIVMNNSKSPYNIPPNQVQVSNSHNFLNNTTPSSQGSTTSQPFNEVNCVSGSSITMNNLTSVAADLKPLTVLSNGTSNHLHQGIQHQDGSLIPQIIVKSDANHVIINSLVKSDVSVPKPVIPGFQQGMRQAAPIVTSGLQPIMKTTGDTSPSLVTVRPHTPISQQQHVLVRAAVAGIPANASPSVQGLASSSNMPIRSALAPPIRPGQIRLTNQVRVQHPNLAPRQQMPQTGTLTIPHGALLMRNESGQLVLVSAPQTVLQQTPGSSNTITTLAPSNCRIQNPLTTQASVRAGNGQTIVTIQPQGTSLQQQLPVQVRGPAMPPVMSTINLQQRPEPTTQAIPGQTAMSISQSLPVNRGAGATVSLEMNKAMIENVKKCKNFLSTLIKLAYSQPAETVKNVRALIQGLIDGKVEPEVFTERLQHELQSSPQPYLVPFLKKSLPLLRQSMTKGHMTIDGVKPPPLELTSQAHSIAQPQIPSPAAVTQQVMAATGTLATRPAVTPRLVGTPVQQFQQFRPSPGPASSKVAAIRQSAPQVAIAPGGNKLVGHAVPQQPSQLSHLTQNQGSLKTPARPTPQAARTIRPVTSTAVIKPEQTSSASVLREKRKFESLKDGDDDINDVATMGGVNLFEESKNILATTKADIIGAQTRSCKDEIFLAASPLLKKISVLAKKYGIEDVSPAVVNIISHATEGRLRNMVTKLSTITEHRIEIYKMDARYEIESETKLKLKFVEELDKLERKRHKEQEREKLLRVIKSRSKNEDPEQLKLKQMAKELQLAEAEEIRQKEANLTALAAIGPRKKRKLDFMDSSKTDSGSSSGYLDSSASNPMMRPQRVKRVNMRDLQFLLECERSTRKSELLYKTFLK